MRICSVSDNLPTSENPTKGLFVQRRLAALAKHHTIEAVLPSPWFPIIRQKECSVQTPCYSTANVIVPYTPGLHALHRTQYFKPLLHYVEAIHGENPIDILDAHFAYPIGAAVFDIGRHLGIPTFITIRGVEQAQAKNRIIAPHLRACLNRSHGIIAVSHSLRKTALELGTNTRNVCVIPNAVETDIFNPINRDSAKSAVGIDDSSQLVVSVGNIEPRKGFGDLLRAFAQLRNSAKKTRLTIIGPYRYRSNRKYLRKLNDIITTFGLKDKVLFLGAQPPQVVAAWLRAADVFALPTKREGCCNAVLEALACGTPVVSTYAGDNPQYIEDGETGFLIEHGDVNSLYKKIKLALNTDWDFNAISQTVSSRSWDDVAKEVIQFMQSKL